MRIALFIATLVSAALPNLLPAHAANTVLIKDEKAPEAKNTGNNGIGYYREKGSLNRIAYKGGAINSHHGAEHWHGTPAACSANDTTPTERKNIEDEVINISKTKWQWMANKNTDSLNALFHEKSMFVHMGGSWGKTRELEVIKDGTIWYKKTEVYSVVVNIIGNTAILLNDIDLIAAVGGNEVVNPFMVTEVYVQENGKWKMGSLTFSRLLRPVKIVTPATNNNNQPH